MASVFDYLDYREFLRDSYRERKKRESFFSYRFIGNHVGMDSSYLIKVLQGQLHITYDKIPLFATVLKLDAEGTAFFELLVHFGKARTEHERKTYFDKLFEVSKVKSRTLNAHHYEFFSRWQYSAIWAIINCRPFDGKNFRDLAALCAPPISAAEAKLAVRLLEKLGLVFRGEDGYYSTTDLNITTGAQWQSQAVEHYQQEMVRLGGESVARFAKSERDVSTVALAIPQDALPEVKALIVEFRKSLIRLANTYAVSDRVFQLNVQLFPLSERLAAK